MLSLSGYLLIVAFWGSVSKWLFPLCRPHNFWSISSGAETFESLGYNFSVVTAIKMTRIVSNHLGFFSAFFLSFFLSFFGFFQTGQLHFVMFVWLSICESNRILLSTCRTLGAAALVLQSAAGCAIPAGQRCVVRIVLFGDSGRAVGFAGKMISVWFILFS